MDIHVLLLIDKIKSSNNTAAERVKKLTLRSSTKTHNHLFPPRKSRLFTNEINVCTCYIAAHKFLLTAERGT